MRNDSCARRVIVVVLDGLRPDAIHQFGLSYLARLITGGAYTARATTVAPSVTAAALTSLMTGVSPQTHGLASDRVFIPKARPGLVPLPEHLARHGVPSSGFMTEVVPLFRGIAVRIGRRLGLSVLHLSGRSSADVLSSARDRLRAQRRGLIVMHWPDADRAGHEYGWMSPQYGEGCRRLDVCLRMLAGAINDPDTLLVALADHGGGGAKANDHESAHPLDRTIPVLLSGAGVAPCELQQTSLLDVPPTSLRALGVPIPEWYEGRVLHEAFATSDTPQPAVA